MDSFSRARLRMVEQQLCPRDIHDEGVLSAMSRVPRERFVDEGFQSQAYQDSPLPIGEKQTISQPFIVAYMVQLLGLSGSETVLEIGTGTGYHAAILSLNAARVYTIERLASLSHRAREIHEGMGIRNVVFKSGDGTLGWREYAPFDAITIAACGPEVPEILLDQLAVGGRLVMPVGSDFEQRLVRVEKTAEGIKETHLDAVRFVPLIGRFGWKKSARQ